MVVLQQKKKGPAQASCRSLHNNGPAKLMLHATVGFYKTILR